MVVNISVHPFLPNAPFLYPLKTIENRKIFLCFQGVEKGCIENRLKFGVADYGFLNAY